MSSYFGKGVVAKPAMTVPRPSMGLEICVIQIKLFHHYRE